MERIAGCEMVGMGNEWILDIMRLDEMRERYKSEAGWTQKKS